MFVEGGVPGIWEEAGAPVSAGVVAGGTVAAAAEAGGAGAEPAPAGGPERIPMFSFFRISTSAGSLLLAL